MKSKKQDENMDKTKKQKEPITFIKFVWQLIVFLLIVALISSIAFSDKIIDKYGQYLEQNKKYASAYAVYKYLNFNYPDNRDYYTEMTKCLVELPFSYNNQKKLLEIAQKDDGSLAESLATDTLKNFRLKVMQSIGINYIYEALYEGVVMRWNSDNFPLTYYIEYTPGLPRYYYDMAKVSFISWEDRTNGLVSFQEVKNIDSAKIIVRFSDNPVEITDKQNNMYQAAVTKPNIDLDNNVITSMLITVHSKNYHGMDFSEKEMKIIMTHEIGHALGIWGHTDDSSSVMYYAIEDSSGSYNQYFQNILTLKDINTLKLLYMLAPDVSDSIMTPAQLSNTIYAPALIDFLENNKEKQVEKAINHGQRNMADEWSDIFVATALSENKRYEESNELFYQLLERPNIDDMTKSIILFNISNNYLRDEQYEKALEVAKQNVEILDNVDNLNMLGFCYYWNKDYDSAISSYEQAFEKDPKNKDAAVGIADSRLAKLDLAGVRKILKELIKNNPDVMNDEDFSRYKIFIIF